MKSLVVIALTAIVIAGCASTGANSYSRVVVMRNKTTGQTAECRFPEMATVRLEAHINMCIKTYRAAGFEVAADSAQFLE